MDEQRNVNFTMKLPSREESIKDEEATNQKDRNDKERPAATEDKHERRKSSRHERHERNDDKLNDEKRKWKLKFEQIQTQLSRTEIQMYDYKVKLNDLMKENANLRENLDTKIRSLEQKAISRENDYSKLKEEYEKLKLTHQSNLIEPNDPPNDSSALHQQSPTSFSSSKDQHQNDQNNNLNINNLIETNRQLLEINEQLKKEIQNLENELEESNDRCREDQENEFKEMKYKLESSVKNTRLLQFKLTRLERAYNQVKVENHHLTNKLKKATELHNLRNRPATPQTEITKTELDKAKEVLLRMHISLQTEKGEKVRMESTINRLEEQLNITKSELLAVSLRNQNQMKNQLTNPIRALSPQSSIDKQLEEKIRDLEEREEDLQEQLKYSEEDSKKLRQKLSAVEQENEILTKQIQSLCNSTAAGKSSDKNEENPIENIVLLKVEQDEQLVQLKNELEEQKKRNQELEKKLSQLQSEQIATREYLRRGSGESIRRGSGEIIRRDSGSESRRDSIDEQHQGDEFDGSIKLSKSFSNSSLNPKVEKVLLKENIKSGILFYEEKIETLQQIKNDLLEKQQENENLRNLLELKRKDKLGKRFTLTRSSSLQD